MESILDIIYVPLAWIFKLCYMLVNNYGLAIILFAFIAKLLMLPLGIKGEKGRLKMQSVQPKVNALQQKYKGDTKNPKYSEELQQLYSEEGYNPMSGCLPTLIQLPIILGLWNAIRRPLTYIVGLNKITNFAIVNILNASGVTKITEALGNTDTASLDAVSKWLQTNEIRVAQVLNDSNVFNTVKSGLEEYAAKYPDSGFITEISTLNLNFLGLDLGMTPSEYIAAAGSIFTWAILLPIISGITSFLLSFLTQKLNAQPTPDGQKNGLNLLMYTMPLLSLWLAFSFQTGVGIYWIASNVLSIGQIFLLRAIVKPPKKEEKPQKEKKLNYNQIEKMKRMEKERENEDAIIVSEDDQKTE
ncbi:MAG: YidC/Oxa1 family membrane protein insertase [Clostridia bacterium]|nr:YidC/Oxa1 family membrane protein insertase [Clostridia bacterium]